MKEVKILLRMRNGDTLSIPAFLVEQSICPTLKFFYHKPEAIFREEEVCTEEATEYIKMCYGDVDLENLTPAQKADYDIAYKKSQQRLHNCWVFTELSTGTFVYTSFSKQKQNAIKEFKNFLIEKKKKIIEKVSSVPYEKLVFKEQQNSLF